MKWFDGITWQTSMRDIGWTYVVLAILLVFLAYGIYQLTRELKH
jgi:hypothetical protein